ncbi:ARM repeat-containing protein [Annulohypoxylon maeteangense]|uniref:ARM repeat-containing protein n=1 Tax=Annulohypoxylon maeteangense TaxID=1927788 RepID=UPI00200762F1|nr:ARM repeat-containing protein [Annulohypoxylon maeteangense]KAI0887504.1 ARM repeat-containing protein [Annulohypoxylon maeteangense]
MASSNHSACRNEFFKELKPRCVAIINLAVRAPDKRASAKELLGLVEDLYSILDRQVNADASVLDEKLAEYVFFPLSNILLHQQQYPIRLTELTIKCLRVLIQHGWKVKISQDLSQQLLIFLTFIIGGVPGQKRKDPIPEETELEAFMTLTSLIQAAGSSSIGAAALVETNAVPALGHAVTIVLDGVTEGRTPDIRLEALKTLDALLVAIRDHAALATFLPGIVSSLSQLLTPPTSLKNQRRVLVSGINALRDVLTKVLGDIKVMGIVKGKASVKNESGSESGVLTASWLKATTAKIKLALSSVLKLRNADLDDVRSALERLCITLLDECHHSLTDCTSILVESAMILADDENEKSVLETSLTDLARIYPEFTDTIKTAIYNWVTSLPRLMQSSDNKVKQQAIRNLMKGQHFITTLQIDSSILDDSLAASLRDSATALILASKPTTMSELPSNAIELDMNLARRDGPNTFPAVLIAQETERSTRTALLEFLSKVGSISQQTKLADDLLNYAREFTGPSQVASYWMAFELVKSSLSQHSDLDDFLDLSSATGPPEESESIFEELYSFSVAILDSQDESEDIDWRLQAQALEVTTFAASRMKESFRPELIDVLYPITTLLGSGVPKLRDHAIISLNNIAASCGYSSVTDLIIDNVDYMVNSVSLRLNTFDISPASTQVLRMMVKLTGPRLIPYLDDVIASIFAALDNYHGYPLFVESLFSVLTEVVQQGSQSDHLLLEAVKSSAKDHRKNLQPVVTTEDIESILSSRIERRHKQQLEEVEVEEIGPHPKHPWKGKEPVETQDEDDEPGAEVNKPPPPKTPTFKILARITDLTQHYLTSPTPTLRKSLLDLLATVCPALSPDEEAFLPLVNSVWPVLVERLYDSEPFVVTSACKALAALCQSAGDFLNTRIKTEWWDNLGKWCRKVKADAAQANSKRRVVETRGSKLDQGLLIPIRSRNGIEGREVSKATDVVSSAGLGRFTQAVRVWEAVQELLVAVVSFVQIDDDVFDQILLLMADSLPTNAEARAAMEAVDPDAVWLLMCEKGMVEPMERPVLAGVTFVDVWGG